MILIHLLTGLVFGVTSVIFSIYAGDGFLVGFLRYSVLGAAGMLLSAALSLLPISGLLQMVVSVVKPRFREKAVVPQARGLRGGFGQEVAPSGEM